jgi:predicted enzyme related to lactoylglutathione lyase
MKDENYICHIIIPTKNSAKSRKFYQEVFRWTIEKQPGTNSFDMLPHSKKGPSAELNPEEQVVVPAIYTTQIETKLKLIEKSGGRTLRQKTPIGKNAEQGHYALFEDPCGNKICLYSDEQLQSGSRLTR